MNEYVPTFGSNNTTGSCPWNEWNETSGGAIGGLVCSESVHVFMFGSRFCQCGKRDSRKQYCSCCGEEIGCRVCGQKGKP